MSGMYPEYCGEHLARRLIKEEVDNYLRSVGYTDYSGHQDVSLYLEAKLSDLEDELEAVNVKHDEILDLDDAKLEAAYLQWYARSVAEGLEDREGTAKDDLATIGVYRELQDKWNPNAAPGGFTVKQRVLSELVLHLSEPFSVVVPNMSPQDWKTKRLENANGRISQLIEDIRVEKEIQEEVKTWIKELHSGLGFLYNDD